MAKSITLPSGHTFTRTSAVTGRAYRYQLHKQNGIGLTLTNDDLEAIARFVIANAPTPRAADEAIAARLDVIESKLGIWPPVAAPAPQPDSRSAPSTCGCAFALHVWLPGIVGACRLCMEKVCPRYTWGLAAAAPTCGRIPPTPGYGPCTRPPHADGPCAHPLAGAPELEPVCANCDRSDVAGRRYIPENPLPCARCGRPTARYQPGTAPAKQES